jgi:protein-S-isoprenylcysteine O-methyltransferase Ste14
MKTVVRLTTSSVLGLIAFGVILFLPAGTLNYWQAWVFIAVFTVANIVPTVYLYRTNPAALQRRMHAGPRAEARTAQKIIITALFVDVFVMMAFSAFDHRMGWSTVPVWVCLLAMVVVAQNGYAASTVTVETGQQVVSGGVYKYIRHPMYVGSLIMVLGMPLALGSYWGLLFIIPDVAVVVFRILDEEKLLTEELAGYREYAQRVRYRLMPNVW